ncbi:cytochrome c oxidase assembly protein [Rhodococcus ruber]|uniref:Cytochrome c oxidase assembly protein n=1 Tax=Rhodococcus ruber TaxID=1830 RepID=A0ABT4ML87_9NOCA|nr:cytochrome c oxidase assembly protein [Rhodococcus ruber]MCZ4521743.1 cytochrome c oxidase assembly protein [Rhodococcus ruber]
MTTDSLRGMPPSRQSVGARYGLAVAFACATVFVVVVTALSGDARYAASGDSFPGTVTSLSYVLLRFTASLAGAITVGSLTYGMMCTRFSRAGRVGPEGYAALLTAGRSSLIWLAAALVLIPVSAADATGIGIGDAVTRGVIFDLIPPNEAPKAWMVSAVAAAVVAIGVRWTLNWVVMAVSGFVAAIGVLPAWVVGNAGQGPNHDIATSAVIIAVLALSVWTGSTTSLWSHRRRVTGSGNSDPDVAVAMSRQSIVAACCAVLVTALSIVLMIILLPAGSVFSTSYGRLAVAGAAVLLPAAMYLGKDVLRKRSGEVRPQLNRAAVQLVGLIVLWAIVTLMAVLPAPAFFTSPATVYDVLLGFEPPGVPSLGQFATFWRFDFVTGGAAVVLIALYGWAVLRLRRRGDHWPIGRTISWMVGCLALLVATSSGVGAYGSAMFGVHMGVHMTLNMFVPVLLVLGGPVTLALRALPPAREDGMPGPREWIVWVVHSPLMRVLSNPAVAVGLFVLSLYAVYFSPLFDELVRYHWGHELMNIHFIVTGYLYYWVIIGIDPGPKRLPHLGRLALLFAVMPFHAFFGIAVMTMDRIIGGTFYRYLDLPWVHDLAGDQRFGGGLAWASSEVPLVLVVVALVSQWARQDRRTEVREDRLADSGTDDELAAYNAMLAQLSRTRK